MDEGRKRVIGIMAAILAARKLAQLENTLPSPKLNAAITDAVVLAERIMSRVDDLNSKQKSSLNALISAAIKKRPSCRRGDRRGKNDARESLGSENRNCQEAFAR
jgi:hypothetical protein